MAVPSAQHKARLELAGYALRVREDGQPHPVADNPVAERDGSFPLPVAPKTLTPRQASRVAIMPTRDYAVSDVQGPGLPEWELQGQFLIGVRGVNGVLLDGYQFQRALEQLIRYYLLENRRRGRALLPLLTLEFHDFYAGEHWQVEPMGVPLGQRDASSPITERYQLTLKGVRPLDAVTPDEGYAQAAMTQDPNEALAQVCPVEAA